MIIKITRKFRLHAIYIIFILALSLVALRSFFHQGMFTTHDGELHMARLASFYASFTEGNLFPRWGANLNYGYGHPTLMFLYPLPNYFGSFLHLLGLSFQQSVKWLFVVTYFVSGVAMYIFLSRTIGVLPAFFGSAIFLFSPYRLVEMYVRGALPEHVFFMLGAFSTYFLYQYAEKPTKILLIITSLFLASLILGHIASAMFFYPFIFIFFLCFTKETLTFRKIFLRFVRISRPFVFGVILSFYYWYPALIEGKYTLRRLIINPQFTVSQLVDFSRLVLPIWGYDDPRLNHNLPVQIGGVNILIFFVSILLFFVSKDRIHRNVKIFLLISFAVLSFLMTRNSAWIWSSNAFLFQIHFPWRLLVLLIFISSLLGALVVKDLMKHVDVRRIKYLIIILSGILVWTTIDYPNPKDYFEKSDNFFLTEYKGKADNEESSPIWSTLTPENVRKENMGIIDGNAVAVEANRKTTSHAYKINVFTKKATFVENTLFFPGWTLYDNGIDVTKDIEYQDPSHKGLITFRLDRGPHEVKLVFKNTKVRQIAEVVSLLGMIWLLLPLEISKVYNRLKLFRE